MLVKRPTTKCTIWVQSVLGASVVQARENLQSSWGLSSERALKSKGHIDATQARRTGASHYRERPCGQNGKAEKARQSFAFRRWRGWWAYSLTARDRWQCATSARFVEEQHSSAAEVVGRFRPPAAAWRQWPLPFCGACRRDLRS